MALISPKIQKMIIRHFRKLFRLRERKKLKNIDYMMIQSEVYMQR